jgi:hypothetical protein
MPKASNTVSNQEPAKTLRRPIKYSQNPRRYVSWADEAVKGDGKLARSISGKTNWDPNQTVGDLLESPNASDMFISRRDKFTPEQLEMTITEFRESIKGKYGKDKMISRSNTINSVKVDGINYPYIIDNELWSTTQEKEKAIKDMANEAGWGKWSIDNVRGDDNRKMFTKVCDLATSNCFLIAAGAVLAAAAFQSGHIGGKKKTIKSKRKTHKKSKAHKKTKNHKHKKHTQSRKRRHSYKKH